MGSSVSHAAAPPPPPPPAAVGLAVALPPKQDEKAEPKNVDWLNLPCPVPFEEIQREALSESPDDRVQFFVDLFPFRLELFLLLLLLN